MATVQTRINRGLRLLGVIASGESPTTQETADALVTLNDMLDSWRNDRLLCFAFQAQSLTLSNGTSSYTIGTGGTLDTTRPVEILNAYIVDSNMSYGVKMINEAEYAAIADKTATSNWPDKALFRPTAASSQATLIVYPVPNATRTMKLTTRVAVTAFAAATDSVTLPPGWDEAIAANLAVRLAPEYEMEASATVREMARQSLAAIKRMNVSAQPRRLYTELGQMFGPRHHNIYTDGA